MIIQPARSWFFLSSACLLAALFSTVQIFLRQRLHGGDPDLLRVATLNLVAWAPWIPIATFALDLLARAPLRKLGTLGRSTAARVVLLHVTAASMACFSFLAYLALFRLATSHQPINLPSLWTAFGTEVGEFFLVSLLLYGLILSLGTLRIDRAGHRSTEPSSLSPCPIPQLEIRSLSRTRYVDTPTIDWISAEGSYVRLHVGNSSFLLRTSLTQLAKKLATSGFSRIHRSTIVNRNRVVELRPISKGDAELELCTGTVLRMSRRYRTVFKPHRSPQRGSKTAPPQH